MRINEIFYSLQGEGFLAGLPSVFVRLAGCPLRCRWCDTKYAWDKAGDDYGIAEIVKSVQQWPCRFVVITGGEPMIDPDLPQLVRELKAAGKHITIETAGIAYIPDMPCDLMSISPKLTNSVPDEAKLAAIHKNSKLDLAVLEELIDNYNYQLKFVVESEADLPEIEETIDHPIIFFGFVNWGYSWIFPSKDKLIVGLGGLNSANKSNLLDLFHNFLSSSVSNQGRRSKITAHPVPAGNFLLRPVFKNVILVGDAAGFVNPITGEGIFYAQRSAELASLAIYNSVHNNENLETSYLQLLRKYVYPELEYAKRVRWFVFVGFNKLRFYPFKIIVRNIMESY